MCRPIHSKCCRWQWHSAAEIPKYHLERATSLSACSDENSGLWLKFLVPLLQSWPSLCIKPSDQEAVWRQQTLLWMCSFREGHYKYYPLQIQVKSPQPWVMAWLWGLWPWQIQDATSSVRSAVEALRKIQGLPPRVHLLLWDPRGRDHTCILPTASPHSAKGRGNRGKHCLSVLHHAFAYVFMPVPWSRGRKRHPFLT